MDLETLRSSFEAKPTDVGAFEPLQDALLAEGKLLDLKNVYETAFDALGEQPDRDRFLRSIDQRSRTIADEGVQAWLNAQLGLVFWKRYANMDRAEVYFRRIQGAASGQGIVGEFYIEFYTARDNWRRLEQLFAESGMTPIEVKRKLAEVATEKGKSDKALGFWQAVLNDDPDDQETYDRLKTLYAEVGKWHSLVELLKSKLDRLGDTDVPAAVAIHIEQVGIYQEHIKSDTKVIGSWQAILALDPGNRTAQGALQKLYEEMKRWPDLVRVLQSRIDHADDPKEILGLHEQIAGIMLERFSNSSEAIKHYQAIIALDSGNLPAIRKLKDLFEQRKSWDQYVDMARREIGLTAKNDAARAKGLVELAGLASERIRSPGVAIELWEEVRQGDPGNEQALTQLEGLYEREKAYDKLAKVLEARYDLVQDDDSRIKLLDKLGLIVGTRLGDEEATADIWRRVLSIDRDHKKAFNELRKRGLATNDWPALEALFREYSNVGELVRTLEAQVHAQDDGAKVPLLQSVASLWQEQGDVPKAVKSLEAILALDSQNATAAAELIPIYESQGEWAKLPDVLDVVLATEEDRAQRQRLLTTKARVHEQHLEDLDGAFFCYVEAYKEDFQNQDLRADFDRLAEASANWEVYVSVLEQVVDQMGDDPDGTTATVLHVARVYHTKLGNPEQALEHYQKVLTELDPGNRTALDATEAIYRETGRWDELVDILRQKLEQGGLPRAEEKALRFELGAVWRDQLGEAEAAMGVYREMMERFPDETRIHDELAHLHLQAEDWESLSDVLGRKLAALVDDSGTAAADLADLQCKLGMLAYSQKGDVGRAVEHYKDAISADAGCDLAVHSLEELLASAEHREEIALALEPVYRARNDDARLADVLEIQLTTAKKKQQMPLLRRLVPLYREKLGDAERALWAASRLFELDPGKKALRETIESLAAEKGEWAHLADLYELTAGDVSDKTARAEMLETVAQTAWTKLADPERAERIYRQVLDESPEHAPALDALETLYTETSEPEKLLEILRKKEALSTSDSDRIDFRFQTASILADQLGRVSDAIDDMREILGLSPSHDMALARLDELYERAEQWLDLHDVLMTRAGLAEDPGEKATLLVRLAELRERQLDAALEAIETYADILKLDRVRGEAVAALERLFADPSHAATIAPVLEPTYQELDDWKGLVRVYTVMEAATEDPAAKVDYRYRMAKLFERQGGDPITAFDHYGAALGYQPEKEHTLAQLLRLAELLENHDDLTTLLRAKVEEVEDEERRREIHRVIAQIRQDQCHDAAGAIEHYQKVLALADTDIPAIDALIELHRAREEDAPLVAMLRHKAPLMEIEELRKELLLEVGDIAASRLADPEQAIEVYELVLGIDPDDATALDALARLYEQTEKWGELVRTIGMKIERTSDLDERKALAREVAGVQEVYLEDLDAAIETRRTILGWDESDLGELTALDELLTKTSKWLDLLSVIDREIALVDDLSKIELKLRKAGIWSGELSDSHEAIGVLRAVLDDDLENARAMQALEDIVRTTGDREAAFEVLEPVLSVNGQYARIYELLDTLAGSREDTFARIEALHRMGALAEDKLTDPERAFACYGRALQEDLFHAESMAAVERLAAAHGLWEGLTLLLQDGATACDDPGRKLELRLRAGEVFKEEIQDFDRAIASYRQVLEDQPDHLAALEALDDLYQLTDRWPDLASVLKTEIDITDDAAKKIGLYFRLAEVSEHRLGDTDMPFQCYREVFYLDPASPAALEQLERIARAGSHLADIATLLEPVYVERAEWLKLHELYELRLLAATDAADRLDLLRRLAELNLDKLGNKSEAVRWYGEAFRLDPMDDSLLGRIEQLSQEIGEWTRLKEVLLAVAIGLEDSQRKVALWHKGARLMEEHLLDASQAELIYELILNEDSADLPALQALDRLYVAGGRWNDLEVALERQIDSAPYEDDKIALLLRLGALLRDRLVRADDAVIAYERALELHDAHPEALKAVADLNRQAGRHADLFGILRRQVDVADGDAARLLYLREMATLAENELGNPKEAIELWEEVLNLDGESRDAIRNIQRLQYGAGNFEELAAAIDRELRILGDNDPGRRAELYRQLGRLWSSDLDDALQSQEAWQHLLEVEDNDVEAMRALAAIHEAAYNHEALAGVLEKMVASLRFDGAELAALYTQLARLWSDQLPEPKRAIWAWEKVRETAPQDLEAVEALERLFTDEARWDDAVAILGTKATLVAPDAAIPVWMSLGETQQYQLGNWQAASDAYRKVLDLQPNHEEAGERLENLYTEHADWAQLATLLDRRAEHLASAADKRDLYVRLADVYERKLEQADLAFIYLQAAHQHAIGDIECLEGLERVAQATGSYGELFDEYEHALDAFSGTEEKIDYGLRAARLLRDKLTRTDHAIDHYRRVLAIADTHEEALDELAQLLELTGQWTDFVAILERRLDNTGDSIERTEIGLRIGEVLRGMVGDSDGAVAAYRKVLEQGGGGEERALVALESIFTQKDRWEDLIEVLEKRAAAGLGDDTSIRLRIGGIREDKLRDVPGAIACYEDILSFNETQKDALDRLLELYAAIDDFDKLTSVYERLLHTAQSDDEQIQYSEALALLSIQAHKNQEAAADYYHRILTIQPGHPQALSSLEQIFNDLERWEDLIDVLRRRLELSVSDVEWVRYKERQAAVYREKLADPDNAIYGYREILGRVPSHRGALDALESLYRETSQPDAVQDILDKKAEHTESAAERTALQVKRAEIVLDDLHDADNAVEILTGALKGDPGNAAGLALLERVYGVREEWENVVDVLYRQGLHATDDHGKAAIERKIALVYRDRLHEGMRAVEHLERALAIVPDDMEAADILARLYVIAEDWIKAEALLELITDRADDSRPAAWRAEIHYNRGLALEHLLRPEDALALYETAHQLSPSDIEVARALGRMAYTAEDYAKAESIYRGVVAQLGNDATEDELVSLYKQLGEIALKRGDDTAARDYLEKTVEFQPGNTDALRGLMTLCEQQGFWQGLIHYASELQSLLKDDLEKFELQLRVGDVTLKHLEDPEAAVSCYHNALDFQPHSKAAHFKIFQVLADAGRYPEAIEILIRLVELEEDGKRKASYAGAIAEMYREKLQDLDQAVHWYNLALDSDPNQLKLFRAIDEILTERRDWKAQQKAYRQMLLRVQDDETKVELQHKLCFALGEIYRTRLKAMDKAKEAFQAALDINPNHVKTLQILSELHEIDDELGLAIIHERKLLALEPGEVHHYRNLKRLFFDTKDLDAAWVACGVLALINQADEREQAFYQEHLKPDMISDARSPDGDVWMKALISKGEDTGIGNLLQIIYQGLGESLVHKELKDLGYKKKNQIDPSERELFAHVYSTSARILGVVPLPPVFHNPKSSGIHIEEVVPPVLVIGDEMRQGKTEQELAFVLGKVLTYFHPLHVAACVASPETLGVLIAAAVNLQYPGYDIGTLGAQPGFRELQAAMAEMPTQLKQGMGKFVSEFVGRDQKVNVNRWQNQVELTAIHAGLLLCNDVVLAGRMLKSTLFTAVSRLTTRDKMIDLAVYALSEEYLALRKEMGIAIQG